MNEDAQDPDDAASEEEQIQVLWPLSKGAEIEVAHLFTVSATQGGNLLEVGRLMLSGHLRREKDELVVSLAQ